MSLKQCHQCQIEFSCDNSGGACWCGELPGIMPMDGAACLCRECLVARINQKINAVNNTELIQLARAYFKEDAPLIKDIDYTFENGKMVFSRWYLAKRGFCCGNQCRHCVYTES